MVTKKRQAIIGSQPQLPIKGLGKPKPVKIKKVAPPQKDQYELAKEAVIENNYSKIRAVVENPNLSTQMRNKIFSDPQIIEIIPHQFIRDQVERDDLHPSIANAILQNDSTTGALRTAELNKVLDKIPTQQRKQYIDRKLGITGGENTRTSENPDDVPFGATPVSDEVFQKEHNWDNWSLGEDSDYDKTISNTLAHSRHLDDSQAEHIKRHGTFKQKYDLYHNENIDPKHGVEMFQKWHDGDTHHGYDPEELTSAYAEHKDHIITPSDIDPEELEIDEDDDDGSIRDAAEEEYPFNDYLIDNGINLWDEEDPSDHRGGDDFVNDHLYENYDWSGENEDAQTSHPHHEKLDEFLSNNDTDTDLETFMSETGHHPSEMGIPYDEESDTVDIDHVRNKLNELGGPAEIDYSNHDDKHISDHPEYDTRYDKSVRAWRQHQDENEGMPENTYESRHYDRYQESGALERARSRVLQNMRENKFNDNKEQFYGNSHQDERFIPEHLKQHIPNLESLKTNSKKNLDGANRIFLDKNIKNREHTHSYGEDQHFYEMVKDAANANNGSIDIGTMHKMYPNQKEKWKKVFGDKGKLKTEEIDNKIAEIPKTNYDISYGKWGSDKMQNVNRRDQTVFRLDHSDESLAPLQEDPELYNTFKRVADVSKRSGHPTKDRTIAWSRVDMSDPKHWMIDEVQSDFGKTVREYLDKEGHGDKASHIDTIEKYHKNWREALLNKVIAEAKKHGVEKISTHSPESKANHTGSKTTHTVYEDSYKKVPRSMGFKPSKMEDLPLNEKGQGEFAKEGESPDFKFILNESRIYNHVQGMEYHAGRHYGHRDAFELATNPMGGNLKIESQIPQSHLNQAKQHEDMFNQHKAKIKELDPEHDFLGRAMADTFDNDDTTENLELAQGTAGLDTIVPHKHDELLNQPLTPTKKLEGHTLDLTSAVKKSMIDLADSLIKAEVLLIKNIKDIEFKEKMLYNITELRKALYEN